MTNNQLPILKAQSSFLDLKSKFLNEYLAFFLHMWDFFCIFAAKFIVRICEAHVHVRAKTELLKTEDNEIITIIREIW